MNSRNYGYQYDTNPRKIKPEYNSPKRKTDAKKSKKTTAKKPVKNTKDSAAAKAKAKLERRTKISIGSKVVLLFAIVFFLVFRSTQINESFSKIQSLKSERLAIQKVNDQIEVNIQNSLNLNKIEQAAKEKLGMQKLSSRQTVYVSLPKKDYVEHKPEEVRIEENNGFFSGLISKLKAIF